MPKDNSKYIRMTTEPVTKLICSLAVPTIISMLVTALYNIADTYFVGQVGTEATAGVGLVFPVMAIIQAFGFFFGQGSGNYISRSLGARDYDKAEYMAATGCFCALLFGCLIMALGLAFRDSVLHVLGAREGLVSDKTIAYAADYMTIILCGAPFMCVSFVFNNQLRFQGNAVFAMIGLVTGAVLNVGLDPIFIFGLHMEVKGAALATAVSQLVSCTMLYIGTLRSDSLKIRLRNFRPTLYYLKNIAVGGLPSLFRQGLASLSTLSLNAAAGAAVAVNQADAAIAAFSVVTKIMMFAFSALLGFGQAFQPVCGFNYGARLYDRVLKAFWFCVRWATIFLAVAGIVIFWQAPQIIAIFRDDPEVVAFGTVAMRAQCCTFFLCGFNMIASMMTQTINKVRQASILAVARQGVFFIPAVLILPHFLGPLGIQLAQSISDVCALLLTIPLAGGVLREMSAQQKVMEKS